MPALEVDALRVRYRDFALGPISLSVADGEFVSLIGPNGSGKSSFIRAILGLNPRVASGAVTLLGAPALTRPRETFGHVGYVTDSPRDVLAEFTAREYWSYCLLAVESARGERITGWEERADEYSRALDFPSTLRRPISALSLGTARKAQIIAALLPEPRILILDEPFIGLDFLASRAFEGLLQQLSRRGVTVLASSHDLDLAARLAHRIVVLRGGQLVLDRPVEELEDGVESAVSGALTRARGGLRRAG